MMDTSAYYQYPVYNSPPAKGYVSAKAPGSDNDTDNSSENNNVMY